MAQQSDKKAEYPHAGLPLPARIDNKDSFFHQPEAVEVWLNKLPLASPLECAKSLFKTLFEMNRVNLTSANRISILENIIKQVENVTSNLKSKYASTTFPLSEKNRKIALLTRELFKEIVIGYKTALAQQIDSGSVKSENNLHIIAVHRTMTYLDKVLFHSYIVYEPFPSNIWRELHLLFTYSSINKIDRIPVLDENTDPPGSSTIKRIYIKALLLSAASPYQLRQREIESLHKELVHLGKQAKLSIRHIRDHQNDIGFLINLHSDKPPIPVAYMMKQENRQLFILDTRQLLTTIQQNLLDHSDNNMLAMTSHLKQLLLKNWGHAPQRQYVRTRLNFNLNIAIGLNEIHQLLESKPQKHSLLDKTISGRKSRDILQRSSMFLTDDDEDDITVLTIDNYNQPELNKGTFLSTQKIEKELQINADELIESDNNIEVDISMKTHECKTVNESTGGYCIEWLHGSDTKIRVGEIVGIQSASKDVSFGLAITRWLKNMSESGLMVGIEILSQSCISVMVRPTHMTSKHKATTYYPGLSIPQTDDDPALLIVPSDLFNEGDVLLAKDSHDEEVRLKLTKLIESTGLFSQYETTVLPSSGKAASTPPVEDEPFLLD